MDLLVLQKLKDNLAKNKDSLRVINFANANVTPKDFTEVMSMLTTNTTVRSLSLENTNICSYGIKELCKMLERNKTLTILDLTNSALDDDGLKVLVKSALKNTSLVFLNICENKIFEKGLQAIYELLSHDTHLKFFDMSKNTILRGDNAKLIVDSLRKNSNITTLNLTGTGINPKYVELLLSINHASLEHLILSNNNINLTECIEALKNNTYIKNLDISSNVMDELGARILSDVFEYNRTLQVLNLCDLDLDDTDLDIMMEGLDSNDVVVEINLADNEKLSSEKKAQFSNKLVQP